MHLTNWYGPCISHCVVFVNKNEFMMNRRDGETSLGAHVEGYGPCVFPGIRTHFVTRDFDGVVVPPTVSLENL